MRQELKDPATTGSTAATHGRRDLLLLVIDFSWNFDDVDVETLSVDLKT